MTDAYSRFSAGLLSEGEVHKARTRLIRTIQREVKMAAKSRKKENDQAVATASK